MILNTEVDHTTFIVPVLINYFQDRKMLLKWNGEFSTARDLPGGGPQGATMGLIE